MVRQIPEDYSITTSASSSMTLWPTCTQMAVTFFRGNKGGCYSVQLIDNPELRDDAVDLFQKGVVSFKEK